jgi:hypothetical protein
MVLSKIKIKDDFLKDKTIMLSTWGCGDKDTFECRDWTPLFKKMFGKLIVFASRNYYYNYGKKALNTEFLRIIQTEKPDYLLFGPGFYGQFYMETLAKIKELSPHTKTIIEFGDDDWRFEDWSRYYALFFDYIITSKKEIDIYKKDNMHNAFFLHGANPDFFKPLNLEKKYDVSFIGRPVANRHDYIKFLKENGIKIKLFGVGWQNYPDLKEVYEGFLYDENYPQIINQSKINLNFSKTLYKKGEFGQLKGRSLEVPLCNAFMLNEYTDKNIEFINNLKEINFIGKEKLLEKIKYYLKHEKEREKLSKKLYDYMSKNQTWELLFTNFFKKIEREKSKNFQLPKFNRKIISFSDKELDSSFEEISNLLKNYDYITLSKGKSESLPYRNYLQSYSLQITGKSISCCDYYVYSRGLGEYMVSMTKEAFYSLTEEDFCKFLNINQIMVTKDYFLKNFDLFKRLFFGEKTKIINEENTAFVSIPIVRVRKIPSITYQNMKKVFHMNFMDELASIFFQKKITNLYLFNFLLAFIRKRLVRKYLVDYLKDTKSLSNIIKSFR